MFRDFKKRRCKKRDKIGNKTDDFFITSGNLSIYFYIFNIGLNKFFINFRNICFLTAYKKISF